MKSDKGKYHMISLICGMWKKDINEIISKTEQTHRHRKQTYGYQRGKRQEEVNEEFGINIDKLLYVK